MAKVEYNRTHVEEKEASMKTYIFSVSLEPDEEGWRAFYAPLEHIGASTWGKTQEEDPAGWTGGLGEGGFGNRTSVRGGFALASNPRTER